MENCSLNEENSVLRKFPEIEMKSNVNSCFLKEKNQCNT